MRRVELLARLEETNDEEEMKKIKGELDRFEKKDVSDEK